MDYAPLEWAFTGTAFQKAMVWSIFYELTGLGYIGVDVVLDRDLGPLVLELNARPGLAIQIANRQGLLRRLKICEERADFSAPAARRIEFAKQEFRHPVGASG